MLHYKPEVYKQLLAHTHFPEEGAEAAAQRWRTVAVRWVQGAALWRGVQWVGCWDMVEGWGTAWSV